MRIRSAGLIEIAIFAAFPGSVFAQAPEPPAAAGTEGSFPWLAIILFAIMATALTMFRSHPKYPKKPSGNT